VVAVNAESWTLSSPVDPLMSIESSTAGILSRTPGDGYPVGPDPRGDTVGMLDILGRFLHLENGLLTVLGGLLLLSGVAGIGLVGFFDRGSWARNGRRAIVGGIVLILPLTAIIQALTWLLTGDTVSPESLGVRSDVAASPIVNQQYYPDVLPAVDTLPSGPQVLATVGNRGESLLARFAVAVGSLTAAVGGLWYWRSPSFRSSFRIARSGLSIVAVVLLFSVVLGPVAWLATGSVTPGAALGSGRTGVTTSFESGTMQGWSIETGTASVRSGPGGPAALHIRGAVERSFDPLPIDGARTLVAVHLDGPGTVTIAVDGTERSSKTVTGEAIWQIPTGSPVTVRIDGSDIWLRSARVAPVLKSSTDGWMSIRGVAV
jgi:hypothetical protein